MQVSFGSETIEVAFTDRLVVRYKGSTDTLESLGQEGLRLLCKPDSEDGEHYRRRRIAEEDIMVVQDPYGITLMTADDWG